MGSANVFPNLLAVKIEAELLALVPTNLTPAQIVPRY